MLDFLRTNIKKFAIFLWIAAAAFIIGGAYLFVRGPFTMGSNTAIQVGDVKISFPEYEKTYNNVYKFYVQLLTQLKGGNFTDEDLKKLNIKKRTIDMLIQRALLLQEAKKEGIKVTKEDVLKAIESNPAFYYNGKFSKEKYLAILKANGINPKDYEESLQTSLYISKLKAKLFKNVEVTDKDVRNFFEKNYTTVDIEFAQFTPTSFKKEVKVNDKTLENYYNKHKNDYRVPTMVKFKYLVVPLNYVEKDIKITDNDTKKFYNNHPRFFYVPLRIRVAHILIAKKDNMTDKQLQEKAEKIYKMIINKKITFKEAAKRFSDDKFTKNVGGDLGYVTKDMVLESFWDHIIKMKKGEISKPFKTKFGYHIAMIEDIKKPFERPYDKVKEQIREYLKTAEAKKRWFIVADKIFVDIRDHHLTLEKAAKKYGLSIKESEFMSLKKPKVPFTSEMVQNALLTGKNALLGPDLSNDGYLIYKMINKKQSYIPKFEIVKNKVKNDYINFEAEKLAKEKAKELLDKLKEVGNFKKLTPQLKLKTEIVYKLGKFTPSDKFPCSYKEDVMDNIFSKGKGYKGLCQYKGKLYVFDVLNKNFDEKEFKKLKKSIKQQLLAEKENEILEKLIEQLKKEVKIKINPKL